MRGRLLKVIDKFMGESAAELEALIEAEKVQASSALSEIERLEAERPLAASFEAAKEIDAQIERLRWLVSKVDASLPALGQQLALRE